MKRWMCLCVLFFPALYVNAAQVELRINAVSQIVNGKDMGSGQENHYFYQPNGPYAAMVFGEDALGNYLAVVRNDAMGGPVAGAWTLFNRVWQDFDWASDVASFAWSPDGKYLFVGKGGVYGNCGLYRLDLENRRSESVFPENPNSDACPILSVRIVDVTLDSIKISYEVHDAAGPKKGKTETKVLNLAAIGK